MKWFYITVGDYQFPVMDASAKQACDQAERLFRKLNINVSGKEIKAVEVKHLGYGVLLRNPKPETCTRKVSDWHGSFIVVEAFWTEPEIARDEEGNARIFDTFAEAKKFAQEECQKGIVVDLDA